MKPKCITTLHERRCKKCQTDKSRCSWRGKTREVIEGNVTISHKRSKGELALEANESSSGGEVEEIVAPRGEYQQLYFTLSADYNAVEYIGR
jgi:hypothetical protein